MKNLLVLFILSISLNSYSQSYSEKWNSLENRYEYFNSQGYLVGYKSYDNINRQWNYYEVSQKSSYDIPVTSSINLPLAQKVLASRQEAYDANSKKIDDLINTFREALNGSVLSDETKGRIKQKFNSEYLNVMYSKKYDFSDTSLTNQVIQWLNKGFEIIVTEEYENLKRNNEQKTQIVNRALNEIAYNSGYYETDTVTDEKFNPYTNEYEVVARDTFITKVFIDGAKNQLYFCRRDNIWRYYTWRYDNSTEDFYELIDVNNGNVLQLSKKFDKLVFYEERVGNNFTKRYIYRHLTKKPTPNNKP